MTDLQQLTQTMNALQQQVERLTLGFTAAPKFQTVFCNRRCAGANWYTIENGEQQALTHSAIRGYCDRVETTTVQRRGKDSAKLQVTIDCATQFYTLEAGLDSEFAKSLIFSLAVLTESQLAEPILVAPRPGEDEAVLFVDVYTCDRRRVYAERTMSFEDALATVQRNLEAIGKNKSRSRQSERAALSAPQAPAPEPAALTPAPPPPAAAVEPPTESADFANLNRLRALTGHMNIAQKHGDELIKKAIALLYPGKKTKELLEREVAAVRDRVLLLYARPQFPASVPDTALMQWLLGLQPDGDGDRAIALAWMALIREKLHQQRTA